MLAREFHIQWHITDVCNLRCLHCYQDSFSKETELSFPTLQLICDNLFDTMKKWNAKLTVAITGGEPFLKEDVWDLLHYLDSSDTVSSLSIITNGTIIYRCLSELEKKDKKYRKLDKLLISLDGVSEKMNDSIRGVGVFKSVISNIRLVKERLDIPIYLMFTLLRRNQQEALELLDFVQSFNLSGFIIERFIPLGRGKQLIDEVVSHLELNELYASIFSQCKVEYEPQKIIKYRALQVKFEPYSSEPSLLGAECIVGADGCALLPDGTVLPCRRFYLPIGNLLTTSLAELWNTSYLVNNIRNKRFYKGKCGSCDISDCFGCRAMTYTLTGDYFASDLHCWLYPYSL